MNFNGYETKTTFWDDFSIAEDYGPDAIQDTFERAFEGWKENTEYITELAMVLNWKGWAFYSTQDNELAQLYFDLYKKLDWWAVNNLTGEDLKYYYRTTD